MRRLIENGEEELGEQQEIKRLSGSFTTLEAVDAFLAVLRSSDKHSATTVKLYTYDLHRFAQVAPDHLDQVTREIIAQFVSGDNKRGLAARHRRYAALSAFYRWLVDERLIVVNPMKTIDPSQLPERKLQVFDEEIIVKILQAIPPTALRDRTLFTLLYETGLQVKEVLGIQFDDLQLIPGQEQVCIQDPKAAKQRVVPLFIAPASISLLNEYLRYSGVHSGPLFRGDPRYGGGRKPLEYSVVHNAWQQYCKTAEVTVSLRQMRSSRIHHLLKAGIPLPAVQYLLGHRQVQSTMFYNKQLDETELFREIEQVIKQLYSSNNPISSLLRSGQERTSPPSTEKLNTGGIETPSEE